MNSELCQKHCDAFRTVAYFSSKLDTVACGLPACLQAVAVAEKAVMASHDFVGFTPLTLICVHHPPRTKDFSSVSSTVASLHH